MTFFSTGRKELKSYILKLPCLKCNHEPQRISIYRTYFHLFFIPIIPFRKKAAFNCPHCGNSLSMRKFLKTQNMTSEQKTNVKSHLKDLIKQTRSPTYPLIFLAIMIIALLGAFVLLH